MKRLNCVTTATSVLRGDACNVLKKLPDSHFSLVVTSPPYNIGKPYETGKGWTLDDYLEFVDKVIGALIPKVSDKGSICWQVGNYVRNGEVFPLDIYTHDLFRSRGMKLRNRIIWRFNFGHNASLRFSGRYETVLWFTKTDKYTFNLDPIRIPQIYPGKRHSSKKGPRAGQPSGNPKGKNPSDFWEFSAEKMFLGDPIWDVPNVKANHPEHTPHPCQFPVELVERCILALTKKGQRSPRSFRRRGNHPYSRRKTRPNWNGHRQRFELRGVGKKTTQGFGRGISAYASVGDLYSVWRSPEKSKVNRRPAAVESYVTYCGSQINMLLSGLKENLPSERWTANKRTPGRVLTTTVINGVIVCLRRIVEEGKSRNFEFYRKRLNGADSFKFEAYKSSQYGSLGHALYDRFFS